MLDQRPDSAPPAPLNSTYKILRKGRSTGRKLRNTANVTPPNAGSGSAPGESVLVERPTPILSSSVKPSSDSTKQYAKPENAKQLAAQAASVATALLNGTIDLEVARAYGTIVRTAAQALSIQSQRDRFLRQEPSLQLEYTEEEG